MAYYMYKKIRDKRRAAADAELHQHVSPADISQARRSRDQDQELFTTERDSNEKTTDAPDYSTQNKRTTEETNAEKKAMRTYRFKIIAGLFFPMLVWSLNKTMIAVALPFIASDFSTCFVARRLMIANC